MWEVKDTTPFRSLGYLVRDRRGAENWVVAVRAVFDIKEDGLLAIAETQQPVRLAPVYTSPDARELAAESDICPFRPKADILVSGIACLPGMASARRFDATLEIGRSIKRAHIQGERILRRKGRRLDVSDPAEFGGVLLSWRSSLGRADDAEGNGGCAHNPLGTGWCDTWDEIPDGGETALPLIENPGSPLIPGQPLPLPHGFGPVQPHWRPRLDHAGTYDEDWQRAQAPLPPGDFDDRFHQAAPEDQQFDLRGGEPVRLINMHPDGEIAFRLPQIVMEAATRIASERIDTRFGIISVLVDAKDKTVDITWNTHLPCNGPDTSVHGSTVRLRQIAGVAR